MHTNGTNIAQITTRNLHNHCKQMHENDTTMAQALHKHATQMQQRLHKPCTTMTSHWHTNNTIIAHTHDATIPETLHTKT